MDDIFDEADLTAVDLRAGLISEGIPEVKVFDILNEDLRAGLISWPDTFFEDYAIANVDLRPGLISRLGTCLRVC